MEDLIKRLGKYNILIAPFVIFVRAPILYPLYALIKLGELAQFAYDAINDVIPGFKRSRAHKRG